MGRRPNRSAGYQYKFTEYSVDFTSTSMFDFELTAEYDNEELSDQLLDLDAQLLNMIVELLPVILTETQWKVLHLYAIENHTQMEVADILGITQSSVTKSLMGNNDYKKGGAVCGGTQKKVKKNIKNMNSLIPIMLKIEHLYYPTLKTPLPTYMSIKRSFNSEDEYQLWLFQGKQNENK
jgi:DNA-binding CsgD family transcriptional regulator